MLPHHPLNPVQAWPRKHDFLSLVGQLNLHGLHFQHVALCERRAWMYLHKINFAQWHERVALGTVKHLTSYRRDRSTIGLFGLAPDRIDWDNRIVYENKGSGGAVVAVNDQIAFYAVMLSIADGHPWRAFAHILTTRKRREVVMDEAQLERLWNSALRLEQLASAPKPPTAGPIPLCDSCFLVMFCGYD